VRSKIFPDIHPPSAMPSIVHMITRPRARRPRAREMLAHDDRVRGTMPPWKSPKSAEIT
jgi:hypothetical protein